jgi:hypothetical protein
MDRDGQPLIVLQHSVALCRSGCLVYEYFLRLRAVSVGVRSSSLYCKYLQYIFLPNWSSLEVQSGYPVGLYKATANVVGSFFGTKCTCSVLRYLLLEFSVVPLCGSHGYVPVAESSSRCLAFDTPLTANTPE